MSLGAKLGVVARLAQLGAHVVTERAAPWRAGGGVPRSTAQLDPAWLTSVLCSEVAGAAVVSVEHGAGSDGLTSRRVLELTYNEAGALAGLPASVFVKSSPTFMSRVVVALSGGLASEALFYQRLSGEVELETPTAHHVGVHEASGRSLFVLEDVARTRKARFGDPTMYVDRSMAESMISQLARLHGQFWDDPRLGGELAWLPTAESFQTRLNDTAGFRRRSRIGLDRAGDLVPASIAGDHDALYRRFMASLAANGERPHTLLHSDPHISNWYLTADGSMGLFDWQTLARGQWALDLTYTLASALTIDDRRAWERDLLRLYLDQLPAIHRPGWDEAWLAYRCQTLHPLIWWLYALGTGSTESDIQPREHCEINVHRFATAVEDLDTVRGLDQIHPH